MPMMGMASIEKDNPLIPYTQGIKATVKLTRVVARIDIVNHIPALKITEISLHNAFKNSCVSKSDTQTARLTNAVKPYSSLPPGGLLGNPDGSSKIEKAFYLYEGKNIDESGRFVYVKIKGTLHGTSCTYNIAFKAKSKTDDTPQSVVDVKRNYLYTIVLGAVKSKGGISFSFFPLTNNLWHKGADQEALGSIKATIAAGAESAHYTYKPMGMGPLNSLL